MYSLYLTCLPHEADAISCALWEAGTAGIREEERGKHLLLIAGFADSVDRNELSVALAAFAPVWEREDDTDWVSATHHAWPAREIGKRVFLAPVWNTELTPTGRVRVTHNPGQASGTGEHPCTQLALESLERCVTVDSVVVDIGTGSGILSVAAASLGSRLAVAVDIDIASLATARENIELNQTTAATAALVAGSADCIAGGVADVVVANISGTVLLALADDLLRILSSPGWLILTGFPERELQVLSRTFGDGQVTAMNEWRCLTIG